MFPWNHEKGSREEVLVDMFTKSMFEFDSNLCVQMDLCDHLINTMQKEEKKETSLAVEHRQSKEIIMKSMVASRESGWLSDHCAVKDGFCDYTT